MKMQFKPCLAIILCVFGTAALHADVVTQNFENFPLNLSSPPANMTTNGWTINDTQIRNSLSGPAIAPHSGTKFAMLMDAITPGVSGTNSYVETPLLSNGVGSVSFYLHNWRGAGPHICEVRINTNGTDWVTAGVVTNTSTTNWTAYTISLGSIYTPVRLRLFKGGGVTADYSILVLDDIATTEAPAKVDISNVAISPTAPRAGDAVSVSAVLTPSTLASNLVAQLLWSANGGASNTIGMTYNGGTGRYETDEPITNQPAFTVINYTVQVTFGGPTPLSPKTTSGSFYFRQAPSESAFSGITVKGDFPRNLELVSDGYWIGVTNVGALGAKNVYFETVNGVTNRWSDPGQTRTNLPIFGVVATNAPANIQIAGTSAGGLLFSFDENSSRYGIQQTDIQSFNTWSNASTFGTYTIEGWTLTQGRATNTVSLAFEGHSIQFASNTAERAIASPALTNGIGTIMFRYRNTETNGLSPAAFEIQTRSTTNATWQTAETVSNIIAPEYLFHSLTVASIDLHFIRIVATAGTAAAQLLIDDIIISRPGATVAYAGLTPTPSNPTITNTVEISANITALNGAEINTVTLWFAASDTSYTMPITFTNFAGRGTLTNFPALVKLTTTNTAGYAGFLDTTSGHDLRFWAGSAFTGTELNYEVETFNSRGTSYIWVKVPTLTQGTTIWASWGNGAYNSQAAYTTNGAVWSGNYVGVWHLSEAVDGTTAKDSTSYGNNGTIQEPPGAVVQSGFIHNGYYCDGLGALNNYGPVNAGTAASLQVNAMTVSGWFNNTAPTERNGYISRGKTATSPNYCNWDLFSTNSTIGFSAAKSTNSWNWSISGGTVGSGWRYVTATWDGTTGANGVKLYVDAVQVAAGTATATTNMNNLSLFLGAQSANDTSNPTFTGTMDEIRLASLALSSNWVWACYMNQGTNHNAFVTYAAPSATSSYSASVYDAIPMTNTSGDTYRATIPRGARGQMLYYIETTYLNPATGGFPAAYEPIDRTGIPAAYTNTDVVLGTQNFEAFPLNTSSPPANMTTNGWTINDTQIRTSLNNPAISPHSGTKFAILMDAYSPFNTSGTNSYVETPLLSNGVGTVSFYLHNWAGSGPYICDVRFSTNDTDWVTAGTVTNTSATNWTAYTMPLNIYLPVRLRFFKGGDVTTDRSLLVLDDIAFTYPPAYVTASDFDVHPAYPSQEEPTTVACTIESATVYHPAFNITGTLKYRSNNQVSGWTSWSSVAMNRSGSHFYGNIPTQLSLSEVEYYVEADFNGYSAAGADQSPMNFPEAPLDYTVRRYISAYDRMNIRIGTNEITDCVQLGNGQWEGIVTFLDPTNRPAFGIDGYGYYNGTSTVSGISAIWGDNNQFRTNMPLAGTATIGAMPITIQELAEGQYIVRFDETTGIYSVQQAVYQDFEHWMADTTLFGESYAAAEITQHTPPFESWDLSDLNLTTDSFEEGWTNAYAYPTNWSIPTESTTTGVNRRYVIGDGIVVTQLVGQAALLNSAVGNVRIQSSFPGDTGSFAFDLRCASPNDFRPAIYSSLTNENIMISAKIKASDMPTNSTGNSIGYAYTSLIGGYSDTNNYFELRIVQTAANNRRFEIWQKNGGSFTLRSSAADNGTSITKDDTVSLLMYRTTGQWTLKAFLNGSTTAKVNTTSTVALTGKGVGFSAMDASPSIDWARIFAISSASYVDTNVIYSEEFTNSPAGWNTSSGAWTASGGRFNRPGYTGTPMTARVAFSTDSGVNWIPVTDFTNLFHSDYRRYTASLHTATNGLVRVRNLSGDGYLIIDNVERVAWRGKTVSTNGWFATNIWVNASGKTGRGIELRNSRALAGASQELQSPTLVDGASVIALDYLPTNATGPVAFAIDYEHRDFAGIWNNATTVTNSTSPTNWVHFSYSVADRNLRPDISRMRIRNLTPGYDDGLLMDNIAITEPVPINNTTWWGYNVLVTDQKPTGIYTDSTHPWLARLANNDFGAFINNSTTNGTGGATNDEYFPFIQSAYLPNGIGEIRFLYRAWDTNTSSIQVVASTNRLLPQAQWTVLDTVNVTNTAYSEYYSAIFERDYRYVALRVNSMLENFGRVGVDNIMITAPLAADLRLSNLRLDPPVPLASDPVFVEVDVDDLFFNPQGIQLQLLYKAGTNSWGDYTNGSWIAYNMHVVDDRGDSFTFRSDFPIPKKAIDAVVQYQIKADFEGFFAEKSSPKYFRNFVNPDHYWPVDLNLNQTSRTPYYFVFSCLPGQVWINEFNIEDSSTWGLYPNGQFIELVGWGNANIGNWRLEIINPTGYSTNATYAFTNGFTIGSTSDKYHFYTFGQSDVATKNRLLTNALPYSGGIQLVRPTGVIDEQVSYDTWGLTDGLAMSLSPDHRFVYAGIDDNWYDTSLGRYGTGSNRTDFTTSWTNDADFSIGTTNFNQTFFPWTTNTPPVVINTAWGSGGLVYMSLSLSETNLVPQAWVKTNLMSGAWQLAAGAGWTNSGANYTVWCTQVSPRAFYTVTVTTAP